MAKASVRLIQATVASRDQAVAALHAIADIVDQKDPNTWYDLWHNSSAIKGKRTFRLRIGDQAIIDQIMPQAKAILEQQLPKGSWVIRTQKSISFPMQGTSCLDITNNVITVYYESHSGTPKKHYNMADSKFCIWEVDPTKHESNIKYTAVPEKMVPERAYLLKRISGPYKSYKVMYRDLAKLNS
jgi:hypothetical protein